MVLQIGKRAGFMDRLFADFCDGVILCLVVVPVYVIIDRWLLGLRPFFLVEGSDVGASDIVGAIWCLWNLTYLVGKSGQFWGRTLAGIKVVDTAGFPIGFWCSLLRNTFAAFVSAPPLYLGFLWVIWDAENQAWHDKVFGTYVIRTHRD